MGLGEVLRLGSRLKPRTNVSQIAIIIVLADHGSLAITTQFSKTQRNEV
jgi:hypothetical protein